jgi:hypothetical protein
MRMSLVMLSVLLVPSLLGAQSSSRSRVPRAGQTLRFRNLDENKWVTGRVRGTRLDTIDVEYAGRHVRLGHDDLIGAKVGSGTKPATLQGLKTGTWAGMAVGTAAGLIVIAQDGEPASDWDGITVTGMMVYGTFGGAFIGAVVGSVTRTTRWARAAVPMAAPSALAGDLLPGDGVRIIRPGGKATGVVIGGAGDSARVRLDTGRDTVVTLSNLERYVGDGNRAGQGLLYGGLAGMALGALAYAAMDEYEQPGTGEMIAGVALNGALFAIIGAIALKGPRPAWSPVTPTGAIVIAFAPTVAPGRIGLVASIRW